jgi:hypothetical protein
MSRRGVGPGSGVAEAGPAAPKIPSPPRSPALPPPSPSWHYFAYSA